MLIDKRNKIQSSVKKNILKFLKYLPTNSELLGHPKGFYKATLDWIKLYYKTNFFDNYVEIYDKHIIKRLKPKTINEEIDWRFSTGYLGEEFETPTTFVAIIPNGRMFGSSGIVITPDDRLLADVSIEFGITPENSEDHSIFKNNIT